MTPTKVEEALELLQWLASDLPPTDHRKAVSEALATLTAALAEKDELLDMIRNQRDVFFDEQSMLARELAESERDAARMSWLFENRYYPLGLMIHPDCPMEIRIPAIRVSIDEAMKDTDHAR